MGQNSKVMNERKGVTNSVTCTNRFAVLADIQEDWDENSGGNSSNGNQKVENKDNEIRLTGHTLPVSHKVSRENMVTQACQAVVTKDRVDEQENVQLCKMSESEECSKMDVTKTNSIVKAVIDGKKCLRQVKLAT